MASAMIASGLHLRKFPEPVQNAVSCAPADRRMRFADQEYRLIANRYFFNKSGIVPLPPAQLRPVSGTDSFSMSGSIAPTWPKLSWIMII
jgi:hypothetical protein